VYAAFAVKAALTSLLETSAAGRYQTAGVQKRKLDAGDVLALPLVTVYYERGGFPKHNSSVNGPYQHDASLRVDIVTAAAAEMDLGPLTNGGPPEQIAAALAAKTDAEAAADAKADETAAILFDIIMRPENRTFGLDDDPGRWITDYVKGKPQTTGAVVILAGYFTLTFQVPEYTASEEGAPGTALRHQIDATPDMGGETREGVVVAAPS
jgi:hypothetical protein